MKDTKGKLWIQNARLVIILSALFLLMPFALAAPVGCYAANSCTGSDVPIFSLSDSENAHASQALSGPNSYPLKVCCPQTVGTNTIVGKLCSENYATAIGLSNSTTNAHAAQGDAVNLTYALNPVCIQASSTAPQLTCYYGSAPCNDNELGVARLSSSENAHVEPYGKGNYPIFVCCTFVAPTYTCGSIVAGSYCRSGGCPSPNYAPVSGSCSDPLAACCVDVNPNLCGSVPGQVCQGGPPTNVCDQGFVPVTGVGTTCATGVCCTPEFGTVTVHLNGIDLQASEPNDWATIQFERNNTDNNLPVNFSIGGSATRGDDYQIFSNGNIVSCPNGICSILIRQNFSTANLDIQPINDLVSESIEYVTVTITPGAGYTPENPDSMTATINDDDFLPGELPEIGIYASDAFASENGPNPGVFTVVRKQSGPLPDFPVNYLIDDTVPDAANPNNPNMDYEITPPGAVVIPAGQNATTILVTPYDDSLLEASPEYIVAELPSGAGYTLSPGMSRAEIELEDNEKPIIIDLTKGCITPEISTNKPEYGNSPNELIKIRILLKKKDVPKEPYTYSIRHTRADGKSQLITSLPKFTFADFNSDGVADKTMTINSSTLQTGVYTLLLKVESPACSPRSSTVGINMVITQQKTAVPEIPAAFAALIAIVVIGIIARKK